MILKVEVNYFSFHCSAEQNLMSSPHSASYDIDRIMREMIVKTKYISNSGTSLCIWSSVVFLTCLQILETRGPGPDTTVVLAGETLRSCDSLATEVSFPHLP